MNLFTKTQLIELVRSQYARLDGDRMERVYTWIADPEIRAALAKFAGDAISDATKRATFMAVDRCLDTVEISVPFGQYAAQMYTKDPRIAQAGLSVADLLYAFRSLLADQDFDLDENGVMVLSIQTQMMEEEEASVNPVIPPPPAPEPEDLTPPAEVTSEHRAIVEKGIKDLSKEINAGHHDGILRELLAAENEKETPRSSAIATIRTRIAWVRGRST